MRIALAGTILVPLIALVAGCVLSYYSSVRYAGRDLDRVLAIVEQHTRNVIGTNELVAEAISKLLTDVTPRAVAANAAHYYGLLKSLDGAVPELAGYEILGPNGAVLVNSQVAPSAASPPPLDAAAIVAATRTHTDTLYIGQRERDPTTGAERFAVAWPWLAADGRYQGAIISFVPAERFPGFVGRLVADDHAFGAGIYAADGHALAHYPNFGYKDIQPLLNTRRTGVETSTRTTFSANDGARLVVYRRLRDPPVYVSASRSWASIHDEWLMLVARYLAIGVPATVALIALSLLGLRATEREGAAITVLRAEMAKRESAEATLRQAQKMDAIGQLTGGIAHDFNNLLTAIGSNIELAERRLAQPERIPHLLHAAGEAVQRAAALTHHLLAFARKQPLDPKPLDAGALVAGMSDLLRRTLGETISLATVAPGKLWSAHLDARQLENAIINLAVNARDAMPRGGKLTIETANVRLDAAYAASHADVAPGEYVMLAVSDTGAGMAPETLERVFDPFFTTKPPGHGTGLGLSMVHGFAKQSGGHITIFSELGRGTTIKLYFPRCRTEEASGPATERGARRTVPLGGGETVLLVEDDAGVRETTADLLADLGYRVIAAAHGTQALERLRANPETMLMLTDIIMPGGMNGRELAEAASALRPGLIVLLTTGYAPNMIARDGVVDKKIRLLPKPFTREALARAVHDAFACNELAPG